ncbi:MAG TPA: hypothetical protein VFK41_10140 [Nocardioidaceae bacterium]|nr:hypothetical protein [Nocardioidaceae bacterium]
MPRWYPVAPAEAVGAEEVRTEVSGVPVLVRRSWSGELIALLDHTALDHSAEAFAACPYLRSLQVEERDEAVWVNVGRQLDL